METQGTVDTQTLLETQVINGFKISTTANSSVILASPCQCQTQKVHSTFGDEAVPHGAWQHDWEVLPLAVAPGGRALQVPNWNHSYCLVN